MHGFGKGWPTGDGYTARLSYVVPTPDGRIRLGLTAERKGHTEICLDLLPEQVDDLCTIVGQAAQSIEALREHGIKQTSKPRQPSRPSTRRRSGKGK